MILNQSQKLAIEHLYGPALILSGAGSGKTLVIVERIIKLINNGFPAPGILALTFTNKAADEMKERVLNAVSDNDTLPHMSTFHSFCLRYIRIYGSVLGIDDYDVIDENDQKKIQKKILEHMNLDIKLLMDYHYTVSSIKNNGLTKKEQIDGFLSGFHDRDEIAGFYREYKRSLKMQHLMDFDDILLYFYEMLDNDDIRKKLGSRYSFVMVDEYQDTNRIQYMILKRLAGDHQNLFVVGDDDQSIYGFRGACVDNILDFQKDFSNAVIIKLEENYRSKGRILKLANHVIKNNQARMEKELKPTRDEGDRITVFWAMNTEFEAVNVCRHIFDLQGSGYDYRDIAVLYRTNAQSRELEDAMREYKIDYKVVGNVGFYNRKEIKDMIAYLRILKNPFDINSLKRIINTPPRRIGEKTFASIESRFNGSESLYQIISSEKNPNIRIFYQLFKNISAFMEVDPSISSLAEYILNETRYYEYLETYYSDFEARIENLESFLNLCRGFEKKGKAESLKDFLDRISLISDQDNLTKTDNTVKLLTVHTAKGLEWPVVFIVGLEEDIFPHRRCQYEPQQIEEERRLFYVASTRAKNALFLSFSKNRFMFGNRFPSSPSRFLREVPADTIEIENHDMLLSRIIGSGSAPDKAFNYKADGKESFSQDDHGEKPEKNAAGKKDTSVFKPRQIIYHKKYGKGIIQEIKNTKPRKKVVILFTEHNCYKTFILDILEKWLIME